MESGRDLFDLFLKRKPLPRPAFVPLVRGLMARVTGATVESITADPAAWANSLVKTADLFDLDAIVAGFHFSVMAEACGCPVQWRDDRPVILSPNGNLCDTPETSGRMKHAIEAAGRIFQVARPRRACVAAITGPLTLARHLFGEGNELNNLRRAKDLLVRVVESFCATSPDALIFMEGHWHTDDLDPKIKRAYGTLKNITSHYQVASGIYVQEYQDHSLRPLSQLGMDIYILGPAAEGGFPPVDDLWALGADALGVGLGLPFHDQDTARKVMEAGLDYYRGRSGVGFFFTSFGPLTRHVEPEVLHDFVSRIRRAGI